jgi:hypothetical protein
METEPPENDDERYVREINETAERDAQFNRVKAQLWRRISAAMKDIPVITGTTCKTTGQASPHKLRPGNANRRKP